MVAAVPPELLPEAAEGLVFDCDGTLVDSMALHFAAWKATCDSYALTITPHLMMSNAGVPINVLLDIILKESGKEGQVDREEFFEVNRGNYKKHHKPATLIEPVMEIVRAAKAKGLKIGVASGGTRWHVTQVLTETGIIDLFDAIVVGDDVVNGKPAPDGFLLAAEKIGVLPHLCVGYEDAKLGLQAIRSAGFMAAVDVTVLEGFPHFG